MEHFFSALLFLVIILVSSSVARLSQRVAKSEQKKGDYGVYTVNTKVLLFSVLVAWFFVAFSNSGSDYDSYYMIIARLNWTNYKSFFDEEPFFNVVCLALKQLFRNNVHAVIFAIKSITYFLFFLALKKVGRIVNLGYSVFFLLLWMYLGSFYLIPMILAASLVYLAYSIHFANHNVFIPFLLIVLAAQFHNTAYFIIPIFLCPVVIQRISNKSRIRVLLRAITIAVFFALAINSSQVFHFLENNIPGFHYGSYEEGGTINSGLFWIIKYLPLFLIVFYVLRKNHSAMGDHLLVLALASALFSLLAYKFGTVARMEYYLIATPSLIFPFLFSKTSTLEKNGAKSRAYTVQGVLIVAYFVFRGSLSYISMVKGSMAVYQFFFPF